MNEALIIACSLAVCFSIIALICGLVCVAIVAGFLRSTHTIQFKPLNIGGEKSELEDPLATVTGDDEPVEENPFKRKRRTWADVDREASKVDTEKEQKEFMEYVTDANNF